MIRVKLDYGKSGLDIELEQADVFYPAQQAALDNPEAEIIRKLYFPDFGAGISEIVRGKKTVAIAHTDITRATPNHIIIPEVIKALKNEGIRREDIVLINMTGSHRPQTEQELIKMLGEDIVSNYACIQHDSFNKDGLLLAGHMEGGKHPLYINKEYLEADVRICTGFIEPHFFAGFSGGPKAVLPGLCDIDTIMRNHNALRIADDNANWGITYNNPLWEHIREGCSLATPDIIVNVALNTSNQISEVFIGEWEQTHRKGCQFVKEHAMIKVDRRYDIVIVTNSGYPLDINLYQCVKGMSCAFQIVKEKGTIIIAGECLDGIPTSSPYHQILKSETTATKLYDKIISSDTTLPEQWQAQIQAGILKKANVYVYSDYLSDQEIKQALLLPCRDIEKLVKDIGGSVAVLPKGPQTIPYLN